MPGFRLHKKEEAANRDHGYWTGCTFILN